MIKHLEDIFVWRQFQVALWWWSFRAETHLWTDIEFHENIFFLFNEIISIVSNHHPFPSLQTQPILVLKPLDEGLSGEQMETSSHNWCLFSPRNLVFEQVSRDSIVPSTRAQTIRTFHTSTKHAEELGL